MGEDNTSLFKNSKFEYNLPTEWKTKAFEELNENPDTVLQELAVFREKVQDVPGLHSRLDDCFLLSFLRAKKFNQEKALRTLTKFYKFRQIYPEYFQPVLPSDNKEMYYDMGISLILRERNPLGAIVDFIRIGNMDFTKVTMSQIWNMVFSVTDFLLFDETYQVGGFIAVVDCANIGFLHLKQVTYKFIKVMTEMLLDTNPVRVKAVHVVNVSVYFLAGFKLVKPFLSKKIVSRFFFHGSEAVDFSNYVEPDNLPEAYGGRLPGFDNTCFWEKFQDHEEEIKEHFTKYGYNHDKQLKQK